MKGSSSTTFLSDKGQISRFHRINYLSIETERVIT